MFPASQLVVSMKDFSRGINVLMANIDWPPMMHSEAAKIIQKISQFTKPDSRIKKSLQ